MVGILNSKVLFHVRCAFVPSKTHKPYSLQSHLSMLFYLKCISSNADRNSFTVSYLINSCGLSPESALLASNKVHFKTPEKPDSVINFFKNHGFSQTQISDLVRRSPGVLLYNIQNNLLPKFNFIYSEGFSSPDLARILSRRPYILGRGLSYLKCILGKPNEDSFTVSYLMNTCGFSLESALLASKKVHFETPEKPDSVINFFKNHGFSQTQISNLIKKFPIILVCNTQKTLLPKFNFFYSKGFSSTDLSELLSRKPFILQQSLEAKIIPTVNLLKSMTDCNYRVILILNRILGNFPGDIRYLASNVAVLREHGLPESIIVAQILSNTRILIVKPDKFRKTVEEAKKMGCDPSKFVFVPAVKALAQMSRSTWERKANAYRKWGWSDEEIVSAFRKQPWCMMVSVEKISATMNFYVNKMGWTPSVIANFPQIIWLSLQKRIIPRCSVLQVLLSKGLIKKQFSVTSLLYTSENKFLKLFVTRYENEAPHLLKIYEEKLGLSK